jgi:fucose 4-O-acetylase-like acetyltransferase
MIKKVEGSLHNSQRLWNGTVAFYSISYISTDALSNIIAAAFKIPWLTISNKKFLYFLTNPCYIALVNFSHFQFHFWRKIRKWVRIKVVRAVKLFLNLMWKDIWLNWKFCGHTKTSFCLLFVSKKTFCGRATKKNCEFVKKLKKLSWISFYCTCCFFRLAQDPCNRRCIFHENDRNKRTKT